MPMRELIEGCRELFGDPPRDGSETDRRAFRFRPGWLLRTMLFLTRDKLRIVLRDQDILREQGRVVWGHLVQANTILFNPHNRQALPANVLYSPDRFFDDQVPLLGELAHGLFDLKGRSPVDKEMRQFAEAITNETARTMRLPLPSALTDGRTVYLTTCFINPPHLPGGCLKHGFFPLVICPEQTEAVMVLPCDYWPEELQAIWTDN
jgi:hypothetical protein